MKILIADDDALFRKMITDIVTGAGHQTVTANDGKAAVQAAVTERPDLILLDVVMPGMLGTEVCEALRRFEKTAAIPVIIVTSGAAELSDEEEALSDFQADDLVRKPVNAWELLKKIEALAGMPSRYAKAAPGSDAVGGDDEGGTEAPEDEDEDDPDLV